MATLTLGPIIGKMGGGADVEVIPVDLYSKGDDGEFVIGHTVTVPAGETWLILSMGALTAAVQGGHASPNLVIGESESPSEARSGNYAWAAEVEGPEAAGVGLKRNTNRFSNADTFVGHVYIVPLP